MYSVRFASRVGLALQWKGSVIPLKESRQLLNPNPSTHLNALVLAYYRQYEQLMKHDFSMLRWRHLKDVLHTIPIYRQTTVS
jgi:hypothetical protein